MSISLAAKRFSLPKPSCTPADRSGSISDKQLLCQDLGSCKWSSGYHSLPANQPSSGPLTIHEYESLSIAEDLDTLYTLNIFSTLSYNALLASQNDRSYQSLFCQAHSRHLSGAPPFPVCMMLRRRPQKYPEGDRQCWWQCVLNRISLHFDSQSTYNFAIGHEILRGLLSLFRHKMSSRSRLFQSRIPMSMSQS
jgi:hypothetical protein